MSFYLQPIHQNLYTANVPAWIAASMARTAAFLARLLGINRMSSPCSGTSLLLPPRILLTSTGISVRAEVPALARKIFAFCASGAGGDSLSQREHLQHGEVLTFCEEKATSLFDLAHYVDHLGPRHGDDIVGLDGNILLRVVARLKGS